MRHRVAPIRPAFGVFSATGCFAIPCGDAARSAAQRVVDAARFGESRGRMCSRHARIRHGLRARSMVRKWHTHRLSASTTAPEAKRLSPMTEDTGIAKRVDEYVDVRRT
jgi:hypothetical protein